MESNVKVPFVTPEQLADNERKPKELTRHDYLNPHFMPNHVYEDFFERTRTSGLAGDLWAVISTAENALDSASGVPIENRGIGTTLQIAKHMASDLVEWCESLEWNLSQAKKRNHYTGEANEAVEADDMKQARDRLKKFEEWTGTKGPEELLTEERAPTEELLAYCRTNGMSLDWLFLGDEKGLVMMRHYHVKEKACA